MREAAIALHTAGQLTSLHLSIAACGTNFFQQIAKLPGMSEISRREYPNELSPVLSLHPSREMVRLLAQRLGMQSLIQHETGWACVDSCYHYFDQKVASHIARQKALDSVYAYEDGALQSFAAAKAKGARCIYDLPIAHWQLSRQILEEESERLPAWCQTMTGAMDSDAKRQRKDEELALADSIICPSQFVADSIPKSVRLEKPVHVIPFGSPENIPAPQPRKQHNGKLRVLFAGSMTQRKGLGDLMAAMQMLSPEKFELHVLGSPVAPISFYHEQCPGFIHHAPRPHTEVLKLMQSCDIFALPSLVEGRALVQQEALSCGLPIIVTANAGAQDLVEDGKAGFLVPIRSPQVIAEKLEILHHDRDLLKSMQAAAPLKAASVTWANYRSGIVSAVSRA
ncbi:glycosyltransferase [Cerasicoccus maritimus]|uniref:glycosyltransferase n=1 Tax=Cerasicoccus maritimus TaxID=490089 RepID=UPI0028525897|nr:glycosyltransferase [Cerasicoccus maritimus]